MTTVARTEDAVEAPERQQPTSPLEALPLCVVLGYSALGLLPLGDPDVWWHLRTGELVLEDGFTRADPWSWTSTEPWLLHEWLSEVVMFLAYKVGGYHGVILLRAVVLGVIALLIVRSCRKVAGPLVTTVVAVVALAATYPSASERPQLASFALLAVMLPRLRQAVTDRRPPWELVPVVWLWANLHLMWSVCLVLFGAMVFGLLFELGRSGWKRGIPFVGIGLASIAAAMLTPNGPTLVLMPLRVGAAPEFITEFSPPTLHDPFTICAVALLACVIVGWARSRAPIAPSEITFVLAAAFVGMSYDRTVAVLAIAVAPLAAQRLAVLTRREAHPVRLDRPTRAIAIGLLLVFAVLVAVWLPSVPGIKRGAPYAATNVLEDLPGRAKVINEYELGGWLLWAGRDTSPGIDGRSETKSLPYLRTYLDALKMQGDWKQFVTTIGADAAWLREEAPLVQGLRSIGWRVVHRDDFTVVLVRPGGQS